MNKQSIESNQGYILRQDQDCHWYVMPENKSKEWDEFLDHPEYGYIDLPKFAKEVDGPPSVVFTQFEIK